jgi:hypothetical protein
MAGKSKSPETERLTKTCFVICPIGDPDSPIRAWSDDVYECIIKPVTEKCGYQSRRAIDISEPGIITSQIVECLIESDLVIADLSFGNPNVFYELAIRHVTKKPCIHLIKIGEKIPFDIAANRTIQLGIDMRAGNKAMSEIERQILSIKKGGYEVDNPIGNALIIKNLRSSGDESQRMIAEVMERIQEIQSSLSQSNRQYPIVRRFIDVTNSISDVQETKYQARVNDVMDRYRATKARLTLLQSIKASKKELLMAESELNGIEAEINSMKAKGFKF